MARKVILLAQTVSPSSSKRSALLRDSLDASEIVSAQKPRFLMKKPIDRRILTDIESRRSKPDEPARD